MYWSGHWRGSSTGISISLTAICSRTGVMRVKYRLAATCWVPAHMREECGMQGKKQAEKAATAAGVTATTNGEHGSGSDEAGPSAVVAEAADGAAVGGAADVAAATAGTAEGLD